jgi:hypothetical protein
MSATKRKSSGIKSADGATKGGRPRLGAQPMSSAERSRRARAKRRAGAQQLDAHRRWKAGWDALSDKEKAERVLADICLRHNLTTDADRVVAMKAVAALGKDSLLYAKLIDTLPPPVTHGEVSATTGTAQGALQARERLLELVLNAVAADQVEAEQQEQSELAGLRAEVARLKVKCGEAPPPPSDQQSAIDNSNSPKVLTPSVGDIVGPREQSDNPANMRGPRYDGPRKPMTIDHEPVKAAAPTSAPSGAWTGPQDGPPPWLQTPAQNAARAAVKPPPAPSSPTPSSPPPPAPTRTQSWDDTPGGQSWRMWADSGGYGGDGLCAAGWIDKLNGR